MYKVAKEIKWEAAHRLFGYNGPCSNIHGHSYKAVFTFEAEELDEMGMVLDFSYIKKEVTNWIDINWDHSLILCAKDPLVLLLSDETKVFALLSNPTAENMARYLFNFFYGVPPGKINLVSVEVFETITSSAIYEK